MRTRRIEGFTLIELLVVISIISVLIAILLPALTQARQMAVNVKCASQLRQMHLGMMLYAEDHSGWGHPAIQWSANIYLIGANDYLKGYFADPRAIHKCPDTDPKTTRAGTGSLYTSYPVMFGQSNWNEDRWFRIWNNTNPATAYTPNVNFMGTFVTNRTQTRFVPNPTQQPFAQDAGRITPRTWNERSGASDVPNNHWRLDVKNTAFMDGHVETHRYDELEIIMSGYQMHVAVPIGWRTKVAP